MEPVISGLISGLVSGLLFGVSITSLYVYEKYQARKAAKDIVNNLKSMYNEKLSSDSMGVKSNNKFN